jgi:hypothetical protein
VVPVDSNLPLPHLEETHRDQTRNLLLTADGLAVVAQLSGLFLWAAIGWTATNNAVWILPFSLLLTSFGWWENYVDKDSPFGINQQPYHFPSKCLSITIHFILFQLSSNIWEASRRT